MITDNFHIPNSKVYFAHISITLKTLSVMRLWNSSTKIPLRNSERPLNPIPSLLSQGLLLTFPNSVSVL